LAEPKGGVTAPWVKNAPMKSRTKKLWQGALS
jgi:hypothetical protein